MWKLNLAIYENGIVFKKILFYKPYSFFLVIRNYRNFN